jgi:uncharacterized damage-inducible protein DinB
MRIADALLLEFDQEMANTRKLLEHVPETITSWKPHEKSMALDRLAGHVAELPGWAVDSIRRDSLDLASPGHFNPEDHLARSRKAALEKFDRSVRDAREAIAGASDAHLMRNWTLMRADQTLLSMPRVAVLRSMVMNHLIHHRAQLGVYLRLNNIPIPGMYGPSADNRGAWR